MTPTPIDAAELSQTPRRNREQAPMTIPSTLILSQTPMTDAVTDSSGGVFRDLGVPSPAPDGWVLVPREVLEPFAAVAEHDIGAAESDADWFNPMLRYNRAPRLTIGDLRRALAVLSSAPPPPIRDDRVAELERERELLLGREQDAMESAAAYSKRATTAEARIKELVEGLEPLVNCWRELRAEDNPTFRLDPDEPITIDAGWLKVGDVWRARALIAKHKDTSNG